MYVLIIEKASPLTNPDTDDIYQQNDPPPLLDSGSHDLPLLSHDDANPHDHSVTLGSSSHDSPLLDRDANLPTTFVPSLNHDPHPHFPHPILNYNATPSDLIPNRGTLHDGLNHQLTNPPLESVRGLFPEHTSNAIATNPDMRRPGHYLAAVSMAFSTENFQECVMTLEIPPDKVQHLAWKWFRTHVEVVDGLRCVSCENGRVRMVPFPSVILRGFRRDLIKDEYGTTVFHALAQGSDYQDEVKSCLPETDRIYMRISSEPQERAGVTILLDLLEGTKIKTSLWC